MNGKIVLSVLGALLVVGVGIFAYKNLPAPQEQSVVEGPSIVGGLVQIGSTTVAKTITVKAQNGEEKTFELPRTIPVTSQVQDGEVGRTYTELNIGDVLSVFANAKKPGVAKMIEIIPIASSTPANTTAVSISGTVVSRTPSSITIKPLTDGPLMATTNTSVTFTITTATQFLTKVLGGQTGKSQSAVVPGAAVAVVGFAVDGKNTASVVTLVPIQ